MPFYRTDKRRNPALWAVSLLVIAGLACSLGGGGPTATPTGPGQADTPAAQPTDVPATEAAPPTDAPAPAGETVTIEIGDNTFTPAILDVAAGTTVVWKHNGARPHTVTADDATFDSGQLGNGDTFEFTFDTATTIAYHCEFHGRVGGEGMSGTINVAAAAEPTAEGGGAGEPQVITAAGDISAAVEQYRALLGPNNGGGPGGDPNGHREINWDGVPEEFSAPNGYPADFFNQAEAPRARGILLTTPGTDLQVSAASDNSTGTPVRFGNINPTYPEIFKAFSEEKLFSPLDSNIVELTFFVPGTQTPALVRGYGAVYTDVDTDHTAFEYFAQDGSSLGRYSVPLADGGLSFLGVVFDQPVVAKVRVEYGTVALGPDDDATNDVAVMDDFIYGEPQAIAAGAEATPDRSAAGEPGFTVLAGPANRDAAQSALDPALVLGANPSDVWMAWSENTEGGSRQIFVSQYDGLALQARGLSLNLHTNVQADQPSITLAGENRAVAWVAWSEPSPGFGNQRQIFASRFNSGTGLWQPAGQDRGGSEPSLNIHTNREATAPVIFAGATEAGQALTPWVAWEELSGANNFVQIFVARAVKDDAALGGFHWDAVGANRFNSEPTLNIDPARDAQHPTAVFAEAGNTVPWVTWHEIGAGRPARVFTARGVADANAPGGFTWVNVPACTADETSCALNVNPLQDAAEATIAAGSLAGDERLPWIVWPEVGPTGKFQILVSRLDPETRNSFLNVGGSLNVDQNHNARHPFITFVGTVPYVAWLEDDGSGRFVIQMRHLDSDPQTGTWVLDTPAGGFAVQPGQPQTGLFALGTPDLVYLAWANGDPAVTVAQMLLSQFQP
jgi:plastocyanin